MKIYIYGTGPSAVSYYETLVKEQFTVLGFLDSDSAKQGELFYGLPIYHIDALPANAYEEIHIASTHLEIVDFLIERGIEKEKIVLANLTLELKYIKKHDLFDNVRMSNEYILMARMAYKKNREIEKKFYWYDTLGEAKTDVSYDYCRCKVAQLLSEEIVRNQVTGDIAELGVYTGDFSKLLNNLFPERKIHLYDTFEGFDVTERTFEIDKGYTKESFFQDAFEDTCVEVVLRKMRTPENCVVYKGKFPDTICKEKETQYALVSIDCDLYVPVLEGLKYFYPRLNVGGYILLHDYNNVQFLGVKKAVEEFEKLYGKMHKVPLSDQGGTLVISK